MLTYLRILSLVRCVIDQKTSGWKFTTLILHLLLFSVTTAWAQVSGTVFQDANGNGTLESTELKIAGVVVTAYSSNSATAPVSVTTGSAGTYAFTSTQVPASVRVRLEFTNLPSGYYDGAAFGVTGGSASTIRFVTPSSTTVNLGLSSPINYCQVNPFLAVPCYVNGNASAAAVSGQDVLVTVPFSASTTNTGTIATPVSSNSVSPNHISTAGQIGSVWGMAYQRETKELFSAAFLKRHVGLGTGGLGGIYLTNPNSTTTNGTLYTDLETLGFDLGQSLLGTRSLSNSPTTSSTDSVAFDLVGKVGLGGMAISEDGTKLFVVDLYNRRVLILNIGNPAKAANTLIASDVTAVTLPNPGCTNGVARPFGITVHNGIVYVGVICTAENATGTITNLNAYVYQMDVTGNTFSTTPVMNFPLNYPKGYVHATYPVLGSVWEPWVSTFSSLHINQLSAGPPIQYRAARPQPILSDIDFADNGDMILSFMDRTGHQLGYRQQRPGGSTTQFNGYIGGDILRARLNNAGTQWVLENNASVTSTTLGTQTGCGVGNTQGPGSGEFFCADNFSIDNSTPSDGTVEEIHQENMMGAAYVVPGTGLITAIQMDPIVRFSGGFEYFNDSNGSSNRRYEIYQSTDGNGTQVNGTAGKANGLGAPVALCNPAPIEIGNRVWTDTNNNGVQDPSETGLAGVVVNLQGPGLVAGGVSVTTTAGGSYYFSSSTSGTTTTGFVSSLTGLTSGGSYTLTFPTSVSTSTISTKANSATGVTADLIDTDASTAGKIVFTLGQAGQNDYSFDVGFVPCTPPSVTLTSNISSFCTSQQLPVTLTTQVSPTGSYTYAVTGPAGVSITGANTAVATATNLASGVNTFTVTVTSAPGCFTTATVSVTTTTTPLLNLTPSATSICLGQSLTLATSGIANILGTTFSEVGPLGNLLNTVTSTVFSPTATTTYLAQVTIPIVGTLITTVIGSCPVTVTVNPNPVIPALSLSLCVGTPLSLSGLTGPGGSLSILTGLTNVLRLGGVIQTDPVSVSAGVNAFNLTSTTPLGCSATQPLNVTGVQAPILPPLNLSLCVGTNLSLSALTGPGGSLSALSGLTNVLRLGNLVTGQVLTDPVSISAGVNTFNVVSNLTTPLGCTTSTPISVTGVEAPIVPPLNLSLCVGTALDLATLTGPTGSLSALNGLTNVLTNVLTGTNISSLTVGIGVSAFNVTSTTPLGCTINTPISFTGVQAPVLPPLNLSVCVGTNLSLSALTGPGGSLSALSGLTNVLRLGDLVTGQVLTDPVSISAGVNTFNVVSTLNGVLSCTTSTPISVTGVQSPVVPPLNLSLCVGTVLDLATLTGPTGSLSALSGLTNVLTNVLTGTNINSLTVGVGVSAFNVTSTTPLGCTINTPLSFTGIDAPVLPPLNLSLCVGTNLSLSALTGPGGSLSALSGLTNVLRLGNLATGQVLTDPVSISAGVNTFNVVSTLNGVLSCTTSTPISVTGVEAPIVPPLNLSLCVGTALDLATLTGPTGSLSALNGLTNILTNVLTGTNISSLTVGVGISAFNVTSTTPLGCTINTPISFTGVQAPVLPPLNLSLCVGTNLSLSALTGPGGSLSALAGLTNVLRLGDLVTGQVLTDPISISAGVNTFNVVSTLNGVLSCTTSTPISVTGVETPIVPPLNLSLCVGTVLDLTALTGTGGSLSALNGLTNVLRLGNLLTGPGLNSLSVSVGISAFNVTSTTPLGCTINTPLSFTGINTPVLPPLNLSLCVGTNLSLSALTGPGGSLSALSGLTNVLRLGDLVTGQVLTDPVSISAGVNTFNVVSTLNGVLSCTTSTPISVTGVETPIVPPLNLSLCVGTVLDLATLTGPGGSLSALNGLTNILTNVLTGTNINSLTVGVGVSAFNVTSTTPLGCSATTPISITGIQTSVVPPLNLSLCIGTNLSLSGLVGPGGSLSALAGLTNVLRLGDLVTGQILTDPVSISAGINTFNVVSTSPLGCSINTPISVTGVQSPVVPPLNLSLCVGTVLDLTALTGTGGSLSALNGLTNVLRLGNLLTGPGLSSLSVGVGISAFNVTSTTPLGCTINTPISFTGINTPVLPPLNLSLCVGTNLSLSALTGPGGSLSALAGLTNVLRLGDLVTGQVLTDPVSISAGINTFNVVSTLNGVLSCTTSTPISVTGVETPIVPPLNLSLCVGTVLDLTALTGTGGSLSALNGLTNVLRLGNLLTGPGLNSLSVSVGISAFNVTSTTPLGCTINTPLSFTGINTPVLPPLNLSLCVGTNLSLSALTGPGGSLSALSGLTNVLRLGDLVTGQVLTDPVSISAGVNTFNVVSTLNGVLSCTTSTPISVTGVQSPVVPPLNLSLCVGTVLDLTALTGTGGSLSALNGLTNVLRLGNLLTGPGLSSLTVGVGISAFNVTSTTPLGCSATTPISITGIQTSVVPPLNLSLCIGTNLSLSGLVGPGGSLSALAGLTNVLRLGDLVTGQILTDPVSISAGINTFNVVSTSPLGCSINTPISVTGVQSPVVPPLNLSLCVGTVLDLTALTGTGGSLSALNGLTNVLRLGNLLTGPGLSSLSVGVGISAFNVTSTTPLGCTINTPISFTGINTPVLPPLNLSLCVGTNLSLSALTGPGGSLSALAGLTNVLRLGDLVTGQVLTDPVSISAGVNTFNVVSTLNGVLSCTTSTPISVTGVETPIVPPLNLSLCVGTVLDLATLTGPGGSLSALNGLTNVLRLGNLLTGPGLSSLSVGVGISAFNVTSTTPLGCSINTPISITGVQNPVLPPLNLSLCVGTNLSLSGLVGPGGSLSALAGLTNVLRLGSLVTGQVLTNPVSISVGVNTFNVTSTGPLGCSFTTPISVTGIQPPVVPPLNLSLCAGTVLNLTALTGTGGSLSALNGLTNVLTNVLTGTNINALTVVVGINAFNVTSTSPLGCTINTPISITGVQQPPVLPPLNLSLCVGTSLSLSSLIGPGTSLSALVGLTNVFSAGGVVLTDPITVTAGVSAFSVVSTNPLGCSATTTVSVSALANPAISLTAAPGNCNPATNQYALTGTVSLTNAQAGVVTITDGISTTTVAVTAGQTSASFVLPGLTSGTGLHTVTASLPACGSANAGTSFTYTAPVSCTTVPPCLLSLTVTPGQCSSATGQYTATGTVTAVNATGSQSVTVTDGTTSSVINLIGNGPTSFTLSGLNSDGLVHTVTASAVSCGLSSTTYAAPQPCKVGIDVTIVDPGDCIPGLNIYYTTGTVSFTNAVAGTLIISDATSSTVLSVTAGQTSVDYSLTNVSGTGSHTVVTVYLGLTASVTYVAPESCTGISALTVDKRVSSTTANVGGTLLYTVVLTNGGATPVSATVRDSLGTGATYVPGSASAAAGTTFTPGVPVSLWSVPNLAPGQSLSLTFQVTVDSAGIIYNQATVPGDTASACTSVPFRVCAGEPYTFRLTAAPGLSSYQWFRNGVAIPNQTTNVLDVSAPGSYSLAVNNATGQCPNFSCCPFVVIEDSIPVFAARAVPATCLGTTVQANGQIVLSGFGAGNRYQFSPGTTFNPAASIPATPQIIPANGVITSTLLSPLTAQIYTVRVFNAAGCFTDVNVILTPTVCGCPADVCVPYVISQTKRAPRIGDPIR